MTGSKQTLLEYHQRSKHRVDPFAPGPRGLDWVNQPDPFRAFDGAPRVQLPLPMMFPGVAARALHPGYAPLVRCSP